MPEEISSPLLALVKEQGLIDDLQYEEVVAEVKRSGTPVFQILQDFGVMDAVTIQQKLQELELAQAVGVEPGKGPKEKN